MLPSVDLRVSAAAPTGAPDGSPNVTAGGADDAAPAPDPQELERICDAALRIIGRSGVAALAAAAVDAEAGRAPGRTRAAYPDGEQLLAALVARLLVLDGQTWAATGGLFNPTSRQELADRLAQLTIGNSRRPELAGRARIALFLVRPDLFRQRHEMLLDLVAVILDSMGVPEPAQRARALVDHVAGVMMHTLTLRQDEQIDRAELAASFLRLLR